MNLPSGQVTLFTLIIIFPSVTLVTVIVNSFSSLVSIGSMTKVAFDLTAVNTVKFEAP